MLSARLARRPTRGMTMIELMVGLTIMAFLLLSGAPSLADWIRNSRIRSAAESIITGLHQARAEAVKRNTTVRFQLTTTLDNDCALSTAGSNWVINLNASATPVGSCASATSDTVAPFIVQKSVAGSGSSSTVIEASPNPVVTFNGFGQQTSTTELGLSPATMTILVKSASGACLDKQGGGEVRCLQIVVSPAGQARMCDPSLSGPTSTQPMACS